MQLKIFKIGPPRPHNKPFGPQNRLQRICLIAIASSTAFGVLCGPSLAHFGTDMDTKSNSSFHESFPVHLYGVPENTPTLKISR